MFSSMIAPLLGILFISLSLIILSPNINPSLHVFMHDHLRQIQVNFPINFLREISLNQIKKIFSIYLLLCGIFLVLCEGLKRLILLIPLSILSIYIIQSIIIYGLTLSNLPIYMFLFICLMIVVFNDCAKFDDLEIK